ncbi:MAG: hypothetical protein K2J99_14965 [Lachnospiraceae bacterium]|nr:hypothetical protein [Lachnospiraceae bacterium]
MQSKKSRFWLFIWSLMPGAGEMYLGFMKMGLSLMLGFMGLVVIAGITNIGALAIFPVAMWFYSFFHANNLASLDEQAFLMIKDEYLFGLNGLDNIEELNAKMTGKKKKVIAAVLIIIGVIMLWEEMFSILVDIFGWDNYFLGQIYSFVRYDLPRFVVGIVIIWVGVLMIRGKKEAAAVEEQKQDSYIEQNPQQNSYNEQDQQ